VADVVMLGVVNEVPVPKDVPPVFEAYQFNVPALEAAVKTTVPVPQRDEGVVEVTDGVVFTVATIAVLPDVQPVAVASI